MLFEPSKRAITAVYAGFVSGAADAGFTISPSDTAPEMLPGGWVAMSEVITPDASVR
jgi:hypothetical protein